MVLDHTFWTRKYWFETSVWSQLRPDVANIWVPLLKAQKILSVGRKSQCRQNSSVISQSNETGPRFSHYAMSWAHRRKCLMSPFQSLLARQSFASAGHKLFDAIAVFMSIFNKTYLLTFHTINLYIKLFTIADSFHSKSNISSNPWFNYIS